jgi:hypothetical protein
VKLRIFTQNSVACSLTLVNGADRILDPNCDVTLSSFAVGGGLVGQRVMIELVLIRRCQIARRPHFAKNAKHGAPGLGTLGLVLMTPVPKIVGDADVQGLRAVRHDVDKVHRSFAWWLPTALEHAGLRMTNLGDDSSVTNEL